eukprot:TRINITY_DN4676_c0_g1_i1.p1 TRINITY_DN4676_c0_g1~~TRINITY_DN4676_c0_g1_i1.p1  ORF type:complete len:573 (-),score=80.22 TRINITY_DN4676_c0_g1_i1:50-1768(-)
MARSVGTIVICRCADDDQYYPARIMTVQANSTYDVEWLRLFNGNWESSPDANGDPTFAYGMIEDDVADLPDDISVFEVGDGAEVEGEPEEVAEVVLPEPVVAPPVSQPTVPAVTQAPPSPQKRTEQTPAVGTRPIGDVVLCLSPQDGQCYPARIEYIYNPRDPETSYDVVWLARVAGQWEPITEEDGELSRAHNVPFSDISNIPTDLSIFETGDGGEDQPAATSSPQASPQHTSSRRYNTKVIDAVVAMDEIKHAGDGRYQGSPLAAVTRLKKIDDGMYGDHSGTTSPERTPRLSPRGSDNGRRQRKNSKTAHVQGRLHNLFASSEGEPDLPFLRPPPDNPRLQLQKRKEEEMQRRIKPRAASPKRQENHYSGVQSRVKGIFRGDDPPKPPPPEENPRVQLQQRKQAVQALIVKPNKPPHFEYQPKANSIPATELDAAFQRLATPRSKETKEELTPGLKLPADKIEASIVRLFRAKPPEPEKPAPPHSNKTVSSQEVDEMVSRLYRIPTHSQPEQPLGKKFHSRSEMTSAVERLFRGEGGPKKRHPSPVLLEEIEMLEQQQLLQQQQRGLPH